MELDRLKELSGINKDDVVMEAENKLTDALWNTIQKDANIKLTISKLVMNADSTEVASALESVRIRLKDALKIVEEEIKRI